MKIRIHLLALMLLITSLSFATSAGAATFTTETATARTVEIKNRVEEIRTMNLSHLSTIERKALKSELKDAKSELKQLQPYVYISVGGLLLIILILILIL